MRLGPLPLEVPQPWEGRDGFALPAAPWDLHGRRWVCVGTVDGPVAAGDALAALARGVGLAIEVDLPGGARRRFLEDVHKAGDVGGLDRGPLDDLGDEHRRLLDALAGGETVTTAAERLHLSRRTANRRLAEARQVLGVDATAAAVSRWAAIRPD